jgi:RNA polymerase sigma-70 factor (ECF subfamily)
LRRRGRIEAVETSAPEAYVTFFAQMQMTGGPQREDHAGPRGGLPAAGARQALELVKLRELSLADASRLSGRSVGALKINVHRAMKALRMRLNGE